MGLFKGKQRKQEIEDLRQQLDKIQSDITPEMRDALTIKDEISHLQDQREALNQEINSLKDSIGILEDQMETLKEDLIITEDEILVQEFGLYNPRFDFANSSLYKDALDEVRQAQKDMVKRGTAATAAIEWAVNGSKAQGRKMVKDIQKLLLRAFNLECDDIVSKVKYTNYDASEKRIRKSAELISKLGQTMHIAISPLYLESKIDELQLAFEYAQKKQEEKEQAREAREAMREAARLQKEIEEKRKKIEKEESHYASAYKAVIDQLASDPDNPDLLQKKSEIESSLEDIHKALADIDYRQANERAGYVYIISNIGSFGENVYKIGMTRRLDPQDRVNELGDASVPFNFDIHAMMFSDDAPALEAALHRAFDKKKVNLINQRREFFNVTLDEIKEVIKNNFDKTVDFIDIPDAEQYRVSEKMRNEI